MKPTGEPPFPTEALGDGEAAQQAEDLWWNEMLAWARGEHGKVVRLCQWAETMGKELPDVWCTVE